jgi:membrane protein YqaA with SNARE-associated domain
MTLKILLKKIRRNENHHKKLYFLAMVALGFILFLPVFYQIRHQEFRSLGLVGVFLLNLIGSATIFLPTPAFLSVGITAIHTNPLLVAFVAALGASLGEGTTFLFGLTSNKFFNLEKHKWLKKLKKTILNKWGGLVILALAFIPNPFFDGVGIVAGLSRYPIKRFLLLTFCGRFLRYIVIGYISVYIAIR